jgi:two-component system chemotaxis sensor kinase CheA
VNGIVDLGNVTYERLGDTTLLSLEGEAIPYQSLGDRLDLPGDYEQARHALVIEHTARTFALGVEAIVGHEEVVVKPLPLALESVPGLSGVTILGAGEVILILDVETLVARQPVVA